MADDTHSELGQMVVERADVRRRLACTKHKLSRYKAILTYAQCAIDALGDRNWRAEGDELVVERPEGIYDMGEGGAFPTPAELGRALQARIDLTKRLANLEQQLDEAGC